MPFVSTIHQQRPHHAGPATKGGYSDIEVPVKPHQPSAGATTATLQTLCSAVPHIRYDGVISHHQQQVLNATGHVAYPSLPASSLCPRSPRLGATTGVSAFLAGNGRAPPAKAAGNGHWHSGTAWGAEVAIVAAAQQQSKQQHRTGTPMAHFMEGGAFPGANDGVNTGRLSSATVASNAVLNTVAATVRAHHDEDEASPSAACPTANHRATPQTAPCTQTAERATPHAVPPAAAVGVTSATPATTAPPPAGPLETYADRHLYPCLSFLRTYGGMVYLLLKSARRSKFLLKNSDIRFIALHLLQQYVVTTPDVRGARNQAVLVAAALFIAAKFCDQNAQIRHVLGETGLHASTVHPSDVYEAEWALLKACNYHVQIPRYWQSACEVALSAPHEGMGTDGLTQPSRMRIQHTALYLDRQLVELSRNTALQVAVLQMNADELAFGCSVAVACSMATPEEAVVALFDSVVVAPLNINFQTLQVEALQEYVRCLSHLAGVLVAEVNASNAQQQQQKQPS